MKRPAILSILMLVPLMLAAQNQLTHKKKIFVAVDGKMYCHKSLPIYVRISNSPDDTATSYLLKSEQTPKYSNPMYLDAEGWNSVRSPSAVDTITKQMVFPEQDIIFDIYADSKSPYSSLVFNRSAVISRKNKFMSKGSLTIEVKASDELSGVEGIYVSLDGGAYQKQTARIILDKEKTYTIKYYAADNVGNVEQPKTEVFVVDLGNPMSDVEIFGDSHGTVISGRSQIKLKSNDSISGTASIRYRLDNQKETIYTSPIYASWMTQGEHSIVFYSVDEVGNKEQEHKFDFFVDKMPPTIIEEIVGKTYNANGKEFSSGISKLKITTIDNKAGVREVFYSLDGKEYLKYEQPVALTAVDGVIDIHSYAIDNVNNRSVSLENSDQKHTVAFMDLNGPSVKHSFTGPLFTTQDTIYINKSTRLILIASDRESGANKVEYSVDGGEITTYLSPFSIDKDGFHTVKYTGYDNVDNNNSAELYVMADNTGPEIYYRFSTNLLKSSNYPTYVVLFLSATDVMSGFENIWYKINQSTTYKPYMGQIKEFTKPGKYEVTIKATDKLGNESFRTIEFTTQ